jgi:DNA-binding XRE family transcriptional regulator
MQIKIDNVSGYRRELSEARDQLARTVGLTPATTPAWE